MAQFKRLQKFSFFAVLFAVLILILFILKPFVNIVALGIILTILFHPLHRKLEARMKSPGLASISTVIIILLMILVPLYLFGHIIFSELNQLYQNYQSGDLVISKEEIISHVPANLQNLIEHASQDINDFVGRVVSNAASSVSKLVSNLAGFILAFFMLFFIVYYLLKDGAKIKNAIMDISPIADNQEEKLFSKIVAAVNGVVKGSFVISLVQGLVATIGFLIFGVPQPFIWGMFTVVAALVPTVGTSLSIIPAIVYLAIVGEVPNAIGLLIWGIVAVGLIDNFLSPRLIGGSMRLHPVLVLLSVIGGLQFFGVLGFLIGPIVMAIFVALVEMYRKDFKDSFIN